MYYPDAKRIIAENYLDELDNFKAKQLGILEEIINKAVDEGNDNTVLKAIEIQNKLMSAYVERSEINATITDYNFKFLE